MSAEHHQGGEHAEKHEKAHEELEQARREKLEELRQHTETEPDHAEKRAEAAREIIKRQEKVAEPAAASETQAPGIKIPFLNHKLNYAETMASVQRKLNPVSRRFSKVIHTPAIEKVSESLEKTVARPSVVFGATWTALIVGGVFYFTARHYGFRLSGSELVLSFIAGALLGAIGESLWRNIKHR